MQSRLEEPQTPINATNMSMDPFVPVVADTDSPKKRSNIGKYEKNYYTLTRKDNNFASRYERNYKAGEQMKHLEDDVVMNN